MSTKKSETSKCERELILKLHNENKSYLEIAKLLNRSKSTIHYIVKKSKTEGNITNKKRTGRPKKLTPREEKMIIREIKKNPSTSAPKLVGIVANNFGKDVHPELCRRVLRSNDYHGRIPRKKPYISKINKKKRLTFAKMYIDKDISFWNKVIFSDESKFNIFGSDGQHYVWRKCNTALQIQNMIATVKHGGGSVMVWGCMAANGTGNLVFIDGIMDKYKYLNILKQNLKQSAIKLNLLDDFYFQQDNDPKHTAEIVKEWIIYNTPHTLQTPPQSPDINPIEHLWAEIARKLMNFDITSKEVLKTKIIEIWNSIEKKTTEKLVYSMESRLRHVIDAKGGPTRY